MEKAELDENQNENINNQEYSENSYDLSEEKLRKNIPIKSKKVSIGSSILHILPIKLNDKNNCQRKPVDEYFEKFIKKNEDEKNDDYDCTLFRGRLLNGKKINIENNDNLKINYFLLEKDEEINYDDAPDEFCDQNEKEKNEYKISTNRKANEYYVWKYDSSIEKDNNLLLLENNIKKLDILS